MNSEYPCARRDETVEDIYHGVKIKDPYRWLEDPDTEETRQFVDAQNAITQPFLEKCQYRNKIKDCLTNYCDYPKYSCPYRLGNKYFMYMNIGLQDQDILYVQDSLDGEPRVFLDPNTLSDDGTIAWYGFQLFAFSEDNKTFAYGLSRNGSDWITIRFKDVESGKELPDFLENVKFTKMTWTHDSKGIFYAGYPDKPSKADGLETEAATSQKLYYHTLGTLQAEDVMVAEFPELPFAIIWTEVSNCGRWLFASVRKDAKGHILLVSDLSSLPNGTITGKLQFTVVVEEFGSDFEYVTNEGSVCIFRTNKDAPNYRLIKIDVENPGQEHWDTLVPQHAIDVLDSAWVACTDRLILRYLHDVKHVLQVHELDSGDLVKILPLNVGTITSFSGQKKYPDIFYTFTSFLTPGVIYRCDLSKGDFAPSVFREMKAAGFEPTEYETKQVFYNSKDGTKVPMCITHRKDLTKTGKSPLLLSGYGGFGYSLQPAFSVSVIIFIRHFNGILAVANLRGGGEYGEEWHNSGRLSKKQNVFDDFHAAAEFLIKDGYTDSEHLSIQGASNGGLLIGACINQRPQLYKAAIANVGVFDMLRFHKFTIGKMCVSEFGSSDDPDQFKYLLKYSPLHNIKEPDGDSQYPAILLTTAEHDDRVVPLHSLKFAAALQHAFRDSKKQTNPLLIRIEKKAGHGGGKPTTKQIEESIEIFSFLQLALELTFQD